MKDETPRAPIVLLSLKRLIQTASLSSSCYNSQPIASRNLSLGFRLLKTSSVGVLHYLSAFQGRHDASPRLLLNCTSCCLRGLHSSSPPPSAVHLVIPGVHTSRLLPSLVPSHTFSQYVTPSVLILPHHFLLCVLIFHQFSLCQTLAVLNPIKTPDDSIHSDTDLAGPLVFCLLFGASLLLVSGSIHCDTCPMTDHLGRLRHPSFGRRFLLCFEGRKRTTLAPVSKTQQSFLSQNSIVLLQTILETQCVFIELQSCLNSTRVYFFPVWQGPFWVHLRHWCRGLPCSVHSPQPDVPHGSLHDVRHQRPGLLPPPHGPPIFFSYRCLVTVSTLLQC